MRRSSKVVIAGIVAAGAIGGVAAFTAGNTVPASVAGYGSATVSGATATAIDYTLSADGTTITGASVVFNSDLTGKTVAAGFNSGAQSDCTLGVYNALASTHTATCSGFSQSTAGATTFSVSVSN